MLTDKDSSGWLSKKGEKNPRKTSTKLISTILTMQ